MLNKMKKKESKKTKTPNTKGLPPGFSLHDNFLENCDEVIDWLEDNPEWQRSGVNLGETSEIRTSSTVFIPMNSFSNPDFIYQMNKKIWSAFNEYAISWNFAFDGIENGSAQKYLPGEKYDLHVDHGPGMPRVASAVLYLNTVEEGGETYFPTFNFGVKPIAGRLVIFPSNFIYAHQAKPPKKGTKYAIAFWATG
jgi:hypothetical protein